APECQCLLHGVATKKLTSGKVRNVTRSLVSYRIEIGRENMGFASYGLAVTVISVMVLSPVWAQTDEPTKRQGPTERSEGRVSLAEEEVLIVLADEASRHFHEARADLFRHENVGAATELLKGAAFVKLEANLASGEDKEALMGAIHDL